MARTQDKAQGEAQPARKPTQKQRDFAHKVVELGCQADAYRAVYKTKGWTDNAIRVEASRLMANPNVALMVEGLQAEAAVKHDITVEFITDGYLEAAQMARESTKPEALTSAFTALGKLHGLVVDKSQNTNFNMDLSDILRARRRGSSDSAEA